MTQIGGVPGVRFFFAVLAAGLLAAAAAGAALSYDGSYLLYRMLEGRWFWIEHGRLTHALSQVVPLAASFFTHNLPVLSFLLSLGYVCIPWLALALAWRLVKDRDPKLFVWAALGAALAALPGLFCLVSDTMLVEQLAWPLFLGALIGIPRRLIPPVLLASVVIATSHPVGFVLFGVASALSWVASRLDPGGRTGHRRWAGGFLAMSVMTLIRVAVGVDAYEKRTFSFESFDATWAPSVLGGPIRLIALSWIAGLLMFAERILARRGSLRPASLAWVRRAGLTCLLLSGAVMVVWASNPRAWAGAIGFRLYLGFATAPFILAALLERMESWRETTLRSGVRFQPSSRGAYLNAIAVVCAAVLATQSWSWWSMTTRLQRTLRQETHNCVSFDSPAMAWAAHTALSHWSISTYSLMVQGDRPAAVVLPDSLCGAVDLRKGLYLTPWYTGTWNTQWFNMDRLRPSLTAGRAEPNP